MPRIDNDDARRFATREEAESFAEDYQRWWYGYSPMVTISEDPPGGAFENRFLAVGSRWHSCD